MKKVLTVEQMKELQKLGIDTSTALLEWACFKPKVDIEHWELQFNMHLESTKSVLHIPTFDYQDILEQLLPHTIQKDDKIYFLTILYDASEGGVITYCTEHIEDKLYSTGSSEIIDAAYEMVLKVYKNAH